MMRYVKYKLILIKNIIYNSCKMIQPQPTTNTNLQHRFPQTQSTPSLNNLQLIQTYAQYSKTILRQQFDLQLQFIKQKHQQQLFQLQYRNLQLMSQLQTVKQQANNWQQYAKIVQMDKQYHSNNANGLKGENKELYSFVESVKKQKQEIVVMYDTEIKRLRTNIDQIQAKGDKQRQAYVVKIKQVKDQLEKEKSELEDNFSQAWKKSEESQNKLKAKENQYNTLAQDYYSFKQFVVQTLSTLNISQYTNEIDLLRKTSELITSLTKQHQQINEYLISKQGNQMFETAKITDRIQALCKSREQTLEKVRKQQEGFQILLNQRLVQIVKGYQKSYGLDIIQQISKRFIDMGCTNQDLQKKLSQSKHQIELFKNQANQLKTQKINNSQKLINFETKIQQLNKVKVNIKLLQQQIQKQKNINTQNERKAKEQQSDYMKLINGMQEEINRVRKQNQQVQLKALQTINRSDNSKQAIQGEIQNLKAEILDKNNIITALSGQIQAKNSEFLQYQQGLKKMRQKYERKKKQIQSKDLQIQALKNQKMDISVEMKELTLVNEEKVNELISKIQVKDNQLAVKSTKLQQIEKDLLSFAKNQCQYQGKSYQEAIIAIQTLIQNITKKSSKSDGFLELDSISKKFQENNPWIKNVISEYSGYKNFKSKFIINFTEPGRDFTKFIDNPDTVIVCMNSKKAIFCIYIKRLGKALTDSDPVAIFSGNKPTISPKSMTKSKGFRTSFVNQNDLILGRMQIIISRSMSQMAYSPNQNGYFASMDSQQLLGIKAGQKVKIEQMQIYQIVQEY